MKILHVITCMRKAAGTSVFCGELCSGLARDGHSVSLAVCDILADDVYAIDGQIRRLSIRQVLGGGELYEVVHIHGLWSPVLHRVAVWARKNRIPVVWSPHGMLTQWAFRFKWWKKWPVWHLYQKRDLEESALVHVTAESEVEDVRRVGLTRNIAIVPLGVRLPSDTCVKSSVFHGTFNQPQQNKKTMTLLYVGRVAKIKCLDHLLRALAESRLKNCRLRVVGPDQEGHMVQLKSLAKALGVDERVDFAGPRYGEALAREYASADCFILPSHSENFGSVVLEALAAGLPVIASKGTPWKILEDKQCGFWVENDSRSLSEAILKMMELGAAARLTMGARGRQFVEEQYTWAAVCGKMIQEYERLVGR